MTQTEDPRSVIMQALYRILKPLARVALRYGVSAGAMGELVRRAYVEAATDSLHKPGRKTQTSRICALTGLYRKEVVRVQALPPITDQVVDDRYNRSTRVISGWQRDPDFHTMTGRPAVLKIEGKNGFNTLVKRYSGDMTPNAMLEELLRLHSVELSARNSVKLKANAYIPQSSELDILQILGTDTADLIETINHNIGATENRRRFQRKVTYVHIPDRHVEDFRLFAAKESQAMLEKLDRWLERRDTEKRSLGTPGSRLGLGIYMIAAENSPAATEPDATKDGGEKNV